MEDPYPSLSDYHDYEPQVIMVVLNTTKVTMTMKNVTLKMIKFNFS